MTTNYFKLESGTRQGDLISAYLFMLTLEFAFLFIMKIKTSRNLIFLKKHFYTHRMHMRLHFFLKTKNL